jgi:hypothetical protein
MTRDARLSALHRGGFGPGSRFLFRHLRRISELPQPDAWLAGSRDRARCTHPGHEMSIPPPHASSSPRAVPSMIIPGPRVTIDVAGCPTVPLE